MKIIDGEKVIWETNNFVVIAVNHPFISREEGGHIIIKEMEILDNSKKYSKNIWNISNS